MDLKTKRALLNARRMLDYRKAPPESSCVVHAASESDIDWETVESFQTVIIVSEDDAIQQHVPVRLASTVECWRTDDLQYDIGSHELVPHHEKIDESETEWLMRRYSLKNRQQLPSITVKDPMARYLNLRVGDVVRIQRRSKTVGDYEVYRCCIKA